ncbi:MAG: hypothetical protein EB084_13050, partial [Proteobacteria bacterium]|nr:hypothetical protein [Pseudomonadota bacterium]
MSCSSSCDEPQPPRGLFVTRPDHAGIVNKEEEVLTDFWDAYRNRVLSGTTAADAACMIHQKVASTGVMLPAITRPAHYLGHMSTLTADFVNHVERLIETPVESSAMLLRS